jgi:hypothetical protein
MTAPLTRRLIANRDEALDAQHASAARDWFLKLQRKNAERERYAPNVLRTVVRKYWLRACALMGSSNVQDGYALYSSLPMLMDGSDRLAFLYE